MSLRDLIKSYTSNIHLKAKLKKRIALADGKVLKKGTVSDILIKKSNNKYHFEAQGTACVVEESEIEFIDRK